MGICNKISNLNVSIFGSISILLVPTKIPLNNALWCLKQGKMFSKSYFTGQIVVKVNYTLEYLYFIDR